MIRILGTGIEGRSENHFAQPRGICLDQSTKELFVCDCNNHRILVFSSLTLAYKRQIGRGIQGSSPGCLNYAVGICLDAKRRHLIVADTNNHRICIFNQETGVHIGNIGSHGNAEGQLSSPYGVIIDVSKDCLFVTDYDNHRVQVYDLRTRYYVRTIGLGMGSGPGQFNQPIMPCIDEETGYLYVADYSNNRVQLFNKDSGKYVRQIGGSGLGVDALHGPRSICIDKDSELLFIADREVCCHVLICCGLCIPLYIVSIPCFIPFLFPSSLSSPLPFFDWLFVEPSNQNVQQNNVCVPSLYWGWSGCFPWSIFSSHGNVCQQRRLFVVCCRWIQSSCPNHHFTRIKSCTG